MQKKIAIIGLGYVGLPLAVEFGKKYSTVGYDINSKRINELNLGIDNTGEISKRNMQSSIKLRFSSKVNDISKCNIFIISVPTPIDSKNNPDLSILFNATSTVASVLKKNDIVIYESTVYPGCTEEDCVPILEKFSKLKYNLDFFCGYSPERINPGDKTRTVTKIVKITSGSNDRTAETVDKLYNSIITVGTYKAKSIKIAEAAKVIENCQRDVNISFVNELAMIFNKMNLDTQEVLNTAQSKWNFIPFKPGLVGGHCIGVDPYYLTYKAKKLGYNSKIINSGRKLNDEIPKFIYKNVEKYFLSKNKKIMGSNSLVLGVTFKENCPDIRNSKVFEIIRILNKNKSKIDIYDPYASKDEVRKRYSVNLIDYNQIRKKYYDLIIISVAHNQFINLNIEEYALDRNSLIYDLKGIFNNNKYMRL